MSIKSKFLVGVLVVAVLLVGFAVVNTPKVAAETCTISTTLRIGSVGADVICLQTRLGGLVADGKFGPMTLAKVKAFQTANGLVVDGIVGPKTIGVLMGGTTGTTGTNLPEGCQAGDIYSRTTGEKCTSTTPTGPLTGGAGDVSISSTSTDVEDSLKEGEEDVKVDGFKVKAEESDIAVTSVKVFMKNEGFNVGAGSSEKLTKYIDEVSIFMDDEKVGSVDASDFSRETSSPDEYTKSISLKNAIVKEGKEAKFYVAVSAISNIDSEDMDNADWYVEPSQIRFQDATGIILTNEETAKKTNNFSFKDIASDDSLAIKTSSSDPDATVFEASRNDASDSYLVGQFKLDVDQDSADITLNDMNINVKIDDNTINVGGYANVDAIINTLTVKIGSNKYDAELVTGAGAGDFNGLTGTAIYNVDFGGDETIGSDETVDVKIYAEFGQLGALGEENYDIGTTFVLSVDSDDDISAESEADELGDAEKTGAYTSEEHAISVGVPTVSLTSADLKLHQHTDGTGAGLDDLYEAKFTFKVTGPEDDDVYLPLDTFDLAGGTAGALYTVTGGAAISSSIISSTTADEEANGYLVESGTDETFVVSVILVGNDAYGKVALTGLWYELTDIVQDGDPAITTGFDDFKTSSVFLAK